MVNYATGRLPEQSTIGDDALPARQTARAQNGFQVERSVNLR
jgi:hypothetical protein